MEERDGPTIQCTTAGGQLLDALREFLDLPRHDHHVRAVLTAVVRSLSCGRRKKRGVGWEEEGNRDMGTRGLEFLRPLLLGLADAAGHRGR